MKEMMRFGFILGLICMVAAGLLAAVNSVTKTKIIAQANAEEQASLREVLPEAQYFEEVRENDQVIYYKALDKERQLAGYAFKVSAKGYSSIIDAVVGLQKDGTVSAIKILSQNETPGLGSRISEPEFTGQFKQKKDLSGVQAITGATISSSAVIRAVQEKLTEVRELIKHASR